MYGNELLVEQVKAERELAPAMPPEAEDLPRTEDLPWVEAEVENSTPEARSGMRWRLALFAYRGQLGPTKHEDWRNFLPKRPR